MYSEPPVAPLYAELKGVGRAELRIAIAPTATNRHRETGSGSFEQQRTGTVAQDRICVCDGGGQSFANQAGIGFGVDKACESIMKRRVQFPEIDRAGVLYFGNYHLCMEEAEHTLRRSMSFSVVTEIDGHQISRPRVRTNCEYYAPARFEDEFEFALRVRKVGSRSVGFEVEFACKGRRIGLGRMTVVFCPIGAGTSRPVSISESLRGILGSGLSPTDQTG